MLGIFFYIIMIEKKNIILFDSFLYIGGYKPSYKHIEIETMTDVVVLCSCQYSNG